MAGSAGEAVDELANKMMEISTLPLNDGYLSPTDPALDFRSQVHAMRDPVYLHQYNNSTNGDHLYQLFDDGNMKEFYEMYFHPETMPLAKFYFFYQILRNQNPRIHDPYYKTIKDEIRRQLFERPPPPEEQSDLYKMLLDADNGRGQHTPLHIALAFIGKVNPSGIDALALKREFGSRKGGKRYSKIKRKSKKMNRKKSRRRHRRSYYTELK